MPTSSVTSAARTAMGASGTSPSAVRVVSSRSSSDCHTGGPRRAPRTRSRPGSAPRDGQARGERDVLAAGAHPQHVGDVGGHHHLHHPGVRPGGRRPAGRIDLSRWSSGLDVEGDHRRVPLRLGGHPRADQPGTHPLGQRHRGALETRTTSVTSRNGAGNWSGSAVAAAIGVSARPPAG